MNRLLHITSAIVLALLSTQPLWAMEESPRGTSHVKRKITKSKVVTPYGELFYRDSGGTGPIVLCIHGNSTSSRLFKKLMRENLDVRFIAFDAPGHGNSFRASEQDAPEVYSLPGCAKVYRQGLKTLNIDKVAGVLGISKGGHEAVHVYAQAPNLMGSLITSGTPYLPFIQGEEHAGRILGTAFKPEPAGALSGKGEAFSLEEAQSYIKANGLDPQDSKWIKLAQGTDGRARSMMFQSILANVKVDECATVRSAKVPVLCLEGAEDAFVNHGYMRDLGFPTHVELQVVEGQNHSFVWNNPKLFNERMMRHLARKELIKSRF